MAKNVSRAPRLWLAKSCQEKFWPAESFRSATPNRGRQKAHNAPVNLLANFGLLRRIAPHDDDPKNDN
jgi:hypothetical protein